MKHHEWKTEDTVFNRTLLQSLRTWTVTGRPTIILCHMQIIVAKLSKLVICEIHMPPAQNLTSRVYFCSPGSWRGRSFFLSACNFRHALYYRGAISSRTQHIIPKLSKLNIYETNMFSVWQIKWNKFDLAEKFRQCLLPFTRQVLLCFHSNNSHI